MSRGDCIGCKQECIDEVEECEHCGEYVCGYCNVSHECRVECDECGELTEVYDEFYNFCDSCRCSECGDSNWVTKSDGRVDVRICNSCGVI